VSSYVKNLQTTYDMVPLPTRCCLGDRAYIYIYIYIYNIWCQIVSPSESCRWPSVAYRMGMTMADHKRI
jgi:hypothetical protein